MDIISTYLPEDCEDDVCDSFSDEFDSENSDRETSDSEKEND